MKRFKIANDCSGVLIEVFQSLSVDGRKYSECKLEQSESIKKIVRWSSFMLLCKSTVFDTRFDRYWGVASICTFSSL